MFDNVSLQGPGGYELNEHGFEDLNVVNGRTTKKTYYRIGLINKVRLTVGRPFWAKGTEHERGPILMPNGQVVGTLCVKVHVEHDTDDMKNEKLAKRVSAMGTDKKIRNNETYLTGFVKVQVAYYDDPNKDHARVKRWEEALASMAKFVVKHAVIEGVALVCEPEHIAAFIKYQMSTDHKCVPEVTGRSKVFKDIDLVAWYSATSGVDAQGQTDHPLNGTDGPVDYDEPTPEDEGADGDDGDDQE